MTWGGARRSTAEAQTVNTASNCELFKRSWGGHHRLCWLSAISRGQSFRRLTVIMKLYVDRYGYVSMVNLRCDPQLSGASIRWKCWRVRRGSSMHNDALYIYHYLLLLLLLFLLLCLSLSAVINYRDNSVSGNRRPRLNVHKQRKYLNRRIFTKAEKREPPLCSVAEIGGNSYRFEAALDRGRITQIQAVQ